MIRVNLVGGPKKKAGSGVTTSRAAMNPLPIVLGLIILGAAAGGYYWYSSLAAESADFDAKIAQATAEKARLEAVIEQDRIYESRKKDLENRITIIEGLKRNQVSPVVSLDVLGDAIDRTQYVWLSSLDQSNTTFSMSGIGTSVNALADFVSNLEATGYFHNINLTNAQDSAGNYAFSMTCEFAPPTQPAASASRGAN